MYVSDPGGGNWEMWDLNQKVVFTMEQSNGEIVVPEPENAEVFYESADCTGTVYLAVRGSTNAPAAHHPFIVNGSLYRVKFGGAVKSESEIRSRFNGEDGCLAGTGLSLIFNRSITEDQEGIASVFVEAETIEEPSYSGPLFIR